MSSTRKKMILGSYVNSSVLPTPPMMRLVLKHRWRTARKNREKNVYHSIRKDFFFFSRLSSDDFFKKSAISCYSNIQKAKTAKKNFFSRKQKSTSTKNSFFSAFSSRRFGKKPPQQCFGFGGEKTLIWFLLVVGCNETTDEMTVIIL